MPRGQRMHTSLTLPCVLLTGFDAFGGALVNASWLAVEQLDGQCVTGHRIVAAQLPTVFNESQKVMADLMRRHLPTLVIAVGQAAGRHALSLERLAININDASLPDNAGQQPVDTPIVPNGPAAYFSSLPVKAMLQALQRASVAAKLSDTAGTFVCNHVFYGLMHALAKQRRVPRPRGGFIHLPCLPDQGAPCMPLDEMVRGLRLAVESALTTPYAETANSPQ